MSWAEKVKKKNFLCWHWLPRAVSVSLFRFYFFITSSLLLSSHLHFFTLLHLSFIGKLTRHYSIISEASARCLNENCFLRKRKKEREKEREEERGKKVAGKRSSPTLFVIFFSSLLLNSFFSLLSFIISFFLSICSSLPPITWTRVKLQGVRTKWNEESSHWGSI